MAFPQLATSAFAEENTDVTTHNATIPASVVSGDLLVFISTMYWPASEPSVSGMPAGWTQVISEADTNKHKVEVWYRIADATETNFTYGSNSVSCKSKTEIQRWNAWHGTTPPEAAGANGANVIGDPNPPSLTPSWGAADTAWIAIGATEVSCTSVATWPANYTANQFSDTGDGSTNPDYMRATRELNATSEDPGAFDVTSDQNWVGITVAIRPAGASLTATAAASRTSGAAPLALQVEGTSSTSPSTSNEYRDCLFKWDFGDDNALVWSKGSRPSVSSNIEYGPVQGHIYLVDGSYTITLTVVDPSGSTDTDTIAITVSDPDTTFSGASTFCYTTGTEAGDTPAGATVRTEADWSTMLADLADNSRYLWKRGDTVAQTGGIFDHTNIQIGAYDSGDRPVLTGNSSMFLGATSGSPAQQATWMDLDFQNTSFGYVIARNSSSNGRWVDVQIYNCRFENLGVHPNEQNSETGDGFYLVSCDFEMNQNNADINQCLLGNFDNAWLAGNHFETPAASTRSGGPEQTVRFQEPDYCAVCHNDFMRSPSGRSMLRVVGDHFTTDEDMVRWLVVSDNKFDARGSTIDVENHGWICQLSAINNSHDARLEDVIFERNFIVPNTAAHPPRVDLGGMHRGTFRFNVWAVLEDVAADTNGFQLRPQTAQRENDDMQFVHNTFYAVSAEGHNVNVVTELSASTNVDVRNNLALHDGTGSVDFSSGFVPGTESNNVDESGDTVGEVFESSAPTNYADFYIQTPNADVIDAGADINDDLLDGALNSIDATPDVGAFQYQTPESQSGGSAGSGGAISAAILGSL